MLKMEATHKKVSGIYHHIEDLKSKEKKNLTPLEKKLLLTAV